MCYLQAQVDSAVKELLRLKAEFKASFNVDWSPNMTLPQQETTAAPASSDASAIDGQIKQCGDKVRDMKAKKADKAQIDAAVKELLALKASYKAATGADWSPNATPAPAPAAAAAAAAAPAPASSQGDAIDAQIKQCGDKVRDLKTKKADKVFQHFIYKLQLIFLSTNVYVLGCHRRCCE